MGHSTGTYLAGLDLLLEVIHRDVHPEVTVQVDDNRIDTAHGIKDGCQPVVVGNLSSVLFTLQTQFLAHEAVAELTPVVLGICHMMGIIITGCTTELSRNRHLLQRAQLFLQTIDVNHDFLAKTRGRSRLTVGLCQHGHILPFLSIVVKLFDELFQQRYIHLFESFLDRKRHTGIVDILRGQAKMYELLVLLKATHSIKTFLDEILYGLHVVIGHSLNILDALRIGWRKLAVDVTHGFKTVMVEILKLGKGQFAKSNKVFYLNAYTVSHQCIFRKILTQRLCLPAIATINRRDGRQ